MTTFAVRPAASAAPARVLAEFYRDQLREAEAVLALHGPDFGPLCRCLKVRPCPVEAKYRPFANLCRLRVEWHEAVAEGEAAVAEAFADQPPEVRAIFGITEEMRTVTQTDEERPGRTAPRTWLRWRWRKRNT